MNLDMWPKTFHLKFDLTNKKFGPEWMNNELNNEDEKSA